MSKKDDRTRVYASILYPDSMKGDYKTVCETIDDWHVSCFLSPLHDLDKNNDGSDKKPHYHLMIMFKGPKSPDQVNQLLDQVGGVGLEKIMDTVGMARYLCHLDQPEKVRYNVKDVKEFGGADYLDTVSTPRDNLEILMEMSDFVLENEIRSIATLYKKARDLGRVDWIRCLAMQSTIWFVSLVKASSFEQKEKARALEGYKLKKNGIISVDLETGEVIEE